MPRPRLRLVLAAALFAIAIGAGFLAVGEIRKNSARDKLFPADLRSAVSFPLYFPSELPGGFRVDQEPARFGAGVVTFSISYGKDSKLVVSEQKKPSDFDFGKFYKEKFEVRRQTDVTGGQLAIGKLNNQTACSLLTDQTWIIANAPSGINDDMLTDLCEHLRSI